MDPFLKLSTDEAAAIFEPYCERNPKSCWNDECLNLGDKKCNSCKVALYCSVQCQKGHWKQHKINCSSVKLEAARKTSLASQPSTYSAAGTLPWDTLLSNIVSEIESGSNLAHRHENLRTLRMNTSKNLECHMSIVQDANLLHRLIGLLVDASTPFRHCEEILLIFCYLSANSNKHILKKLLSYDDFFVLRGIVVVMDNAVHIAALKELLDNTLIFLFNSVSGSQKARMYVVSSSITCSKSDVYVPSLLLDFSLQNVDSESQSGDIQWKSLQIIQHMSEYKESREVMFAHIPNILDSILAVIQSSGVTVKVKQGCLNALCWHIDDPSYTSSADVVRRTTQTLIQNCFLADNEKHGHFDMKVSTIGVLANMSNNKTAQVAMASPHLNIVGPNDGGILPLLIQSLTIFKTVEPLVTGILGLLLHLLGPEENKVHAKIPEMNMKYHLESLLCDQSGVITARCKSIAKLISTHIGFT